MSEYINIENSNSKQNEQNEQHEQQVPNDTQKLGGELLKRVDSLDVAEKMELTESEKAKIEAESYALKEDVEDYRKRLEADFAENMADYDGYLMRLHRFYSYDQVQGKKKDLFSNEWARARFYDDKEMREGFFNIELDGVLYRYDERAVRGCEDFRKYVSVLVGARNAALHGSIAEYAIDTEEEVTKKENEQASMVRSINYMLEKGVRIPDKPVSGSFHRYDGSLKYDPNSSKFRFDDDYYPPDLREDYDKGWFNNKEDFFRSIKQYKTAAVAALYTELEYAHFTSRDGGRPDYKVPVYAKPSKRLVPNSKEWNERYDKEKAALDPGVSDKIYGAAAVLESLTGDRGIAEDIDDRVIDGRLRTAGVDSNGNLAGLAESDIRRGEEINMIKTYFLDSYRNNGGEEDDEDDEYADN